MEKKGGDGGRCCSCFFTAHVRVGARVLKGTQMMASFSVQNTRAKGGWGGCMEEGGEDCTVTIERVWVVGVGRGKVTALTMIGPNPLATD